MKMKRQTDRVRRLPTSVPVPVDAQFVEKFMEGGWDRVKSIYGKRAQVWVRVIGKKNLKAMREQYLAERSAQTLVSKRKVEI